MHRVSTGALLFNTRISKQGYERGLQEYHFRHRFTCYVVPRPEDPSAPENLDYLLNELIRYYRWFLNKRKGIKWCHEEVQRRYQALHNYCNEFGFPLPVEAHATLDNPQIAAKVCRAKLLGEYC